MNTTQQPFSSETSALPIYEPPVIVSDYQEKLAACLMEIFAAIKTDPCDATHYLVKYREDYFLKLLNAIQEVYKLVPAKMTTSTSSNGTTTNIGIKLELGNYIQDIREDLLSLDSELPIRAREITYMPCVTAIFSECTVKRRLGVVATEIDPQLFKPTKDISAGAKEKIIANWSELLINCPARILQAGPDETALVKYHGNDVVSELLDIMAKEYKEGASFAVSFRNDVSNDPTAFHIEVDLDLGDTAKVIHQCVGHPEASEIRGTTKPRNGRPLQYRIIRSFRSRRYAR